MNNNIELWDEVLAYISTKVNGPTFSTFISPVRLKEKSDNPPIAYLEASKEMIVNVVKRRYSHLFAEAFSNILDKEYKVIVKNSSEYKEKPRVITDDDSAPSFTSFSDPIFRDMRMFDPNLTFDNFIVGDCNNVAAAVCKAVADSPSDVYNPLFVYGNSGLGKTHLLNAIGIYLLENNQEIKVLYVSAETFTNDFIKSLQSKKQYEFKDKYRKADVLLIDDIQFLEDKVKTQDEFFFTFDSLLQDNKQIIVSGDRSPSELSSFDERLKSRFLMNTTVGVYAPDYEMRVAILQKKAELMNIEMNDEIKEVIEFIADKNKDNIRTLEGYFTTVVNISREVGQKPSLPFAKILLKDIVKDGSSVTPQKIKSAVAKYYNIKVSDLDSTSRKAEFAYPRQVAMYLCRTMTEYSLPRIGTIFGNKHYSTVKHACDKIEEEVEIDESIREIIKEIKESINLL